MCYPVLGACGVKTGRLSKWLNSYSIKAGANLEPCAVVYAFCWGAYAFLKAKTHKVKFICTIMLLGFSWLWLKNKIIIKEQTWRLFIQRDFL